MPPRTFSLFAAVCLWLALAIVTQAAPRIAGPVRYEVVNQQTQIALSADLIQNNSKENATGTLQLQLWATTSPYEDGTIRGHLLGSAKLENLDAGQYYKNLRRVVAYDPPSTRGNYFITMTLMEYRAGAYVIVHHVNMKAKAKLGPLPLFTMEGPWKFQTSYEGGTVEISVAKISHRRTGHTGTLKLAVWLTDEPYTGGRLYGYEIGDVRKEPLKAGFVYNDVKNTAKFTPPPAGNYYASLVLSESNGEKFEVVEHLNIAKPIYFKAAP